MIDLARQPIDRVFAAFHFFVRHNLDFLDLGNLKIKITWMFRYGAVHKRTAGVKFVEQM